MTHGSVAPAPRQSAPAGQARLRVLLVEDDEADAFLVQELFAEVKAPVDVFVATTVAQARDAIHGVDCVLLDLGLPDAQGLDGLRRLLAVADSAAICVLTGLGDDHIGAAAVAEGAQDYLIKGQVDGVLLARAVRYAVERKKADENARALQQAELRQAESARLERGLLPKPLVRTTEVAVHTFYQPGRRSELGGDFFDVVQTGPDRLTMMVGDVCGHGVDEAALGVELRVAWRALMLGGVPDDAVLPALEQVLISERNADEVFATLAMVTIQLDTAEATVRLAGHPPPLLLRGGETIAVPAHFGPVLGVFERANRTSTHLNLPSTDWCLLLYTDGLIEGRTGEDDKRLGTSGLQQLITSPAARALPRPQLAKWLVTQAEAANDGPLVDDVAMLLLCREGMAR